VDPAKRRSINEIKKHSFFWKDALGNFKFNFPCFF